MPRFTLPQQIAGRVAGWLISGSQRQQLLAGARVEREHDAPRGDAVERVVPHQRRAFLVAAARAHDVRPGQAQPLRVGAVDLLERAVACFGLVASVAEPRRRAARRSAVPARRSTSPVTLTMREDSRLWSLVSGLWTGLSVASRCAEMTTPRPSTLITDTNATILRSRVTRGPLFDWTKVSLCSQLPILGSWKLEVGS